MSAPLLAPPPNPNPNPHGWVIDFAYDKAAAFPLPMHGQGHGYSARAGGLGLVDTLIYHSTNGHKGSTFKAEAVFLRDSPLVSAHYLVGKSGRITRILDPIYEAWHAGWSRWQGRTGLGRYSIGIECHHAIGDPWPAIQLDALAWLTRELYHNYPRITKARTLLHRWVAIYPPDHPLAGQLGRKVDPSDMDDAQWRAFIAAL